MNFVDYKWLTDSFGSQHRHSLKTKTPDDAAMQNMKSRVMHIHLHVSIPPEQGGCRHMVDQNHWASSQQIQSLCTGLATLSSEHREKRQMLLEGCL